MKTIQDILKSKDNQEVWSVRPKQSVLEALQLMAQKQIGGLLVMEHGNLYGIITERDYARKVVLDGLSSNKTPVSEIMTRQVLCITPDRTIDEGLALMTDKRARHLPVLDGEQVIGLVSIGDLVKATIDEQKVLIDQLQNYISGY